MYLYDIINGLSIQHVYFHRVLRNFSSVAEQSTFKNESIVAAAQGSIVATS